jgi:hypothetical protein
VRGPVKISRNELQKHACDSPRRVELEPTARRHDVRLAVDVAAEGLEAGEGAPAALRGGERALHVGVPRWGDLHGGERRRAALELSPRAGEGALGERDGRRDETGALGFGLVVVFIRLVAYRADLRDDGAEDPGVAALVEGVDTALAREAEARPRAHLVALDEREDLLDALALGGREDEVSLGERRSRAKIDDPQRPVPAVDEEAQRDGVVVEKKLLDPAVGRDDVFGCHTHPAPARPRWTRGYVAPGVDGHFATASLALQL